MGEALVEFFAGIPNEIIVFLVSIFPIVELRGAIPIGAALGVPFYSNYLLSVLGNMLPTPFILLFIPKFLDFLARFKIFRPMVLWIRKKAIKHSGKVMGDDGTPKEIPSDEELLLNSSKNAEAVKMTKARFTALLLFVAIPFPGTGAWTGGLIASLFNLPKRWSLLAILSGVMLAGVIMCLASYGVVGFLSFLN